MTGQTEASVVRVPIAGLLSWLVPGLGHLYLGERKRGLILLVTVSATFWTGVAIGGVRATVDPGERQLWFVAQLGSGGNAVLSYVWGRSLAPETASESSKAIGAHWASAELGVHYTGVAGLLNLLVIFDAIGRAESRPPPIRKNRGELKGPS